MFVKSVKKVPGREQETKYIKPVTFLFFMYISFILFVIHIYKVKDTLISPERTHREHYIFKHISIKSHIKHTYLVCKCGYI